MPRSARISVTIPPEVLTAADQAAARLRRSRSWVVAEALRRYAGTGSGERGLDSPLGEQRLLQLRADLALTPEARVRAAEATARVSALVTPPAGTVFRSFDRYEDYLRWKDREAAGG